MPSQVTVGHHKVTANFLNVNMWSKIIFNQVDLKKLSEISKCPLPEKNVNLYFLIKNIFYPPPFF